MLENKKAVAAGRFYESNPATLKAGLKELFAKALPNKTDNVLAIISPHAGYAFSGEVAATSFNQIDPTKEYDNIFILAPSHSVSFDGASIYNKGNYITPLGEVKVNIKLADKLIKENDIFTYYSRAHDNEHSLEVQLPFLQYIMKTDYRIVPIVLGVQSVQPCKKIAEALKPFFNEKNLFIISTDFSHYPAYEDANLVDKLTAQAIETNSVDNLKKAIDNNSRKNIRNLSTSLCGWSSVFSLLYITEDNPNIDITALQYKNSGDYPYGDKFGVVGYYSLV
ncbi:MAG: AmmeMemoRadiSam system protein B, partial [Bacteroidetes bacterium]|nr:AmmeMemoRadiSam system protein B [Bacteroidota bacterium]